MDITESYRGVCDLCGKEADAAIQDCMNIVCTKGCNRGGGDLYHQDCIKKFIGTASKGSIGRMPKIPYSNFGCPKGKSNKTAVAEPCKGLALHCKRVHYKSECKSVPPPQVINPVLERRKAKREKATNPVMESSRACKVNDATGWETVGRRRSSKLPTSLPLAHKHDTHLKLPPIPQVPKPDPLGRNLCGKKPQELPVGFPLPDQCGGGKGKSAKKNKKRAAKRKDIASNNGLGEPPLLSWDNGDSNIVAESTTCSDAGGSDCKSLMGTSKFITDIDAYHRLLAGQLSDTAMESDYDEEGLELISEEVEECSVPDFVINEAPTILLSDSEGFEDMLVGWQHVPRSPSGRSTGSNQPLQRSKVNATALNITLPYEDDVERRATLTQTISPSHVPPSTDVDDYEFQQQLARVLAESQRVEQDRREQERAEELALLAHYEGNLHGTAQQAHDSRGLEVKATPILSYSHVPRTCAPLITLPVPSVFPESAQSLTPQSSGAFYLRARPNTIAVQESSMALFLQLPPPVQPIHSMASTNAVCYPQHTASTVNEDDDIDELLALLNVQ